MPIISLAQTKGGCAKSTLAQCLAYSNAFRKKYKSIALVELDIQGTLKAWHSKHITSTDADGVALAAIQGLNLKLEEKQTEIDSLKKEFTERFASLEQRLLAMEASMN